MSGGLPRVVFHVDMDAFFAAVEQLDDPSLRGRPVIVGGLSRRSVVATASYEARPFGVHSAMPMARALALCPQAVVVAPRMERYAAVSRALMEVLARYSPSVEPLSVDEAFLDMTGTEGLFGPPERAARALKADVRAATGISASVGIAANKFLAKLASDLDKPDGLTVVPRGGEAAFIAPLPVRRLWGVGPRAAERLAGVGLAVIGDVARAEPAVLARALGASWGEHVKRLALGLDERPVEGRGRQSVGSEVTLDDDVRGRQAVEGVLRPRCEAVAHDLRQRGALAASVRVKLRYARTFRLATRQAALPSPSDDSRSLFDAACELLGRFDLSPPIRLVGVAAFDLCEPQRAGQLELFDVRGAAAPVSHAGPAAAARERRSQLEHALDRIVDKFGPKIRRGP